MAGEPTLSRPVRCPVRPATSSTSAGSAPMPPHRRRAPPTTSWRPDLWSPHHEGAVMRTVLLIVHTVREEATKVAATFATDLRQAGLGIRVLDSDAAALRQVGLEDAEIVPAGEGAAEGCELAVVFGGDGTILRAAEMCRGTETPVLGVNLGHVGFLAEADVEDIHEVVRGVVDRSWTVEERLTIDVSVTVGGEVLATTWDLHEAAVRKAVHRH